MHSHAASSSATLRGMFVRKKLLCHSVFPAPADVEASLPEVNASSPTLRQRLDQHLSDPSCSGCHNSIDLIGLGLENFDGIGRWRSEENEASIDPSGSVDDTPFADAWELGAVVAQHPDFGPCFAEQLYEYALGHQITEGEKDYQAWLADSFAHYDWSFLEMMRNLAMSEAFRSIGDIDPTQSNDTGDGE